MRYELETLDDFVGKLLDFKVQEVGMRTQLFVKEVLLKEATPATTNEKNEVIAAVPEVKGKQISTVFSFTAVGKIKTWADEFEVPIVFQETLPFAIVVTEADGEAFNKDLEAKKNEYIAAIEQTNAKMRVLTGSILPTQHSRYGLGAQK